MKKAIFYEGDYDRKVIERVIDGLQFGTPLPIRANGKHGMKSFIQGYLEANRVQALTSADVIAFRDRDFDFPVPKQPGLIIPSNIDGRPDPKIRVSYRTTIENYLLYPAALFEFCQKVPAYIACFPSEREAKRLLDEAAEDILAYQAARHALGAIRKVSEQSTKLTEKSGKLPVCLSEEYCREQCKMQVHSYR